MIRNHVQSPIQKWAIVQEKRKKSFKGDKTAPKNTARTHTSEFHVEGIAHLQSLFQTGLISSSFKCPSYTMEYNVFVSFFFISNFWRKLAFCLLTGTIACGPLCRGKIIIRSYAWHVL